MSSSSRTSITRRGAWTSRQNGSATTWRNKLILVVGDQEIVPPFSTALVGWRNASSSFRVLGHQDHSPAIRYPLILRGSRLTRMVTCWPTIFWIVVRKMPDTHRALIDAGSTVSFSSFSVRGTRSAARMVLMRDVHLPKSSNEVGDFCGLTARTAALCWRLHSPCWPAAGPPASDGGIFDFFEQQAGFAELMTDGNRVRPRQRSIARASRFSMRGNFAGW